MKLGHRQPHKRMLRPYGYATLPASRTAGLFLRMSWQCSAPRQSARDLDELSIHYSDLPTRCELEASLRATQTGRAAGVDQLPGEILHYAAASSSRTLFQLALKIGMRVAEPLAFKGGALQTVWKGKLSPLRPEAHRGILVSSCIGKSLHRAVRSRATGPLADISSPLQIGGLPCMPVTIASQAIRLFQSGAQRRKASYSLVFLDLREAFYRVIRHLFTGSRFNDEDFAALASQLRLKPDVLATLHQHMQADSLPQAAGASQWVSMSLSEILDCTWFRFRRSPTVVQTGIGSRPGDNCTDLLFSYLFACVLRDLQEELRRAQVLVHLPWDPAWLGQIQSPSQYAANTGLLPVMDSTWMDDLSLMVMSTSAAALPATTATAVRALVDQCLSRGLVPNFARGKTEVMTVPQGPGSRAVRAQAFRDADPCLQIHSTRGGTISVRLVTQYRHLGGLVHHTGEALREARHRIGLAQEAFQKHKRRVFSLPSVPFRTKATLYASLVLSVLMHGAGTWIGADRATLQALSTAHTLMACSPLMRPCTKGRIARPPLTQCLDAYREAQTAFALCQTGHS